MSKGLEVNTAEFGKELQRYLTVSNKDVEEIVNTKAFFITLGAYGETPRIEKSQIAQDLAKDVIGTRHRNLSRGTAPRGVGPRAALIINARRGKRGEKGLSGTEMALAIATLRAIRELSVYFLRSTWLPGLREFGKKVPSAQIYKGGKFADKSGGGDAQVIGRDKGEGLPADQAQQGWNLQAEVSISLDVKGRSMARIAPSMSTALQAAIDKEAASMAQYFDRKMAERAREFNSR